MGRTLDAIYYPVQEARPFSKTMSSFKFGGSAGVVYEYCVSTYKPKLVWLNGPFPAGIPDKTVYKTKGLWQAIKRQQTDRDEPRIRVIADDGYFTQCWARSRVRRRKPNSDMRTDARMPK